MHSWRSRQSSGQGTPSPTGRHVLQAAKDVADTCKSVVRQRSCLCPEVPLSDHMSTAREPSQTGGPPRRRGSSLRVLICADRQRRGIEGACWSRLRGRVAGWRRVCGLASIGRFCAAMVMVCVPASRGKHGHTPQHAACVCWLDLILTQVTGAVAVRSIPARWETAMRGADCLALVGITVDSPHTVAAACHKRYNAWILTLLPGVAPTHMCSRHTASTVIPWHNTGVHLGRQHGGVLQFAEQPCSKCRTPGTIMECIRSLANDTHERASLLSYLEQVLEVICWLERMCTLAEHSRAITAKQALSSFPRLFYICLHTATWAYLETTVQWCHCHPSLNLRKQSCIIRDASVRSQPHSQ